MGEPQPKTAYQIFLKCRIDQTFMDHWNTKVWHNAAIFLSCDNIARWKTSNCDATAGTSLWSIVTVTSLESGNPREPHLIIYMLLPGKCQIMIQFRTILRKGYDKECGVSLILILFYLHGGWSGPSPLILWSFIGLVYQPWMEMVMTVEQLE
jgi:hypothetical protein